MLKHLNWMLDFPSFLLELKLFLLLLSIILKCLRRKLLLKGQTDPDGVLSDPDDDESTPAYSCGRMGRLMTLWKAEIQSRCSASVSQAKRNFLSGVTMVMPWFQRWPCVDGGRPARTV